MTRRQMAAALLAPAALPAPQPAAAQAQAPPEDLTALAARNLERNREAMAKFQLEMSVEPAFRFEA